MLEARLLSSMICFCSPRRALASGNRWPVWLASVKHFSRGSESSLTMAVIIRLAVLSRSDCISWRCMA